jgi:cytochrome c-type biogenesis protein
MDVAALVAGLGPFGIGVASAASPCLLPLYPGYIAYLASNARALEGRSATGLLGLLVLLGVLTTMSVVGIVLIAIAVPTSRLLAIATPLIDAILVVLGILLIAGRNPFERLPGVRVPLVANPYLQAWVYGVMLGPIALPCAGPFLVSLLAISIGIGDAVGKLATFFVFGLGFGLPLVVLSLLAGTRSREIVAWIVAHRRPVELVAGVALVVVALVDLADKWENIRLTLGV